MGDVAAEGVADREDAAVEELPNMSTTEADESWRAQSRESVLYGRRGWMVAAAAAGKGEQRRDGWGNASFRRWHQTVPLLSITRIAGRYAAVGCEQNRIAAVKQSAGLALERRSQN